MKRRHYLELLGYTVVSLPFWKSSELQESDERKEYLRGKLHISFLNHPQSARRHDSWR